MQRVGSTGGVGQKSARRPWVADDRWRFRRMHGHTGTHTVHSNYTIYIITLWPEAHDTIVIILYLCAYYLLRYRRRRRHRNIYCVHCRYRNFFSPVYFSGRKNRRRRGRRCHQFGVQRECQILRGLAVVWRENRQTVKRIAAKRPPATVCVNSTVFKVFYVTS